MSKWIARKDTRGNWLVEEEHEITLEGVIITVLGIIGGLILLLLLFAVLLGIDSLQTNRRKNAEQREHEAQMAISASIWDLDIVESDAIYGNKTMYDSDGNVYTGEFREFCAWSKSSDVHEPCVIVDINENYEYTRFTGTIFTRPEQDEDLAITFQIFADGKCIYNSGEMHTSTNAINLNLDVEGVNQLMFIATTEDYGKYCNPAVILVNAVLHAE